MRTRALCLQEHDTSRLERPLISSARSVNSFIDYFFQFFTSGIAHVPPSAESFANIWHCIPTPDACHRLMRYDISPID